MIVRAQDPTTDDALLVEVTLAHVLPAAQQRQMYLPGETDLVAGTVVAVARGWAQSLYAAGMTMESPSDPAPPTGSVGSVVVSGARGVFRDGFASDAEQPNPATWIVANDTPTLKGPGGEGHIVEQGGDSQGSRYLRISLSPFNDRSSVSITTKGKFRLPVRLGWGISVSQRFVGQEVFFGIAEASDSDESGINKIPASPDLPIGGNIVVTSNVGTVTLANHPFRGGDRVILIDNTDHRLNVGPVQVTIVDRNTFTVPIVLANGTYAASGSVRHTDPANRANNAFGMLLDNATATNAWLVARRNGSKYRMRSSTIATTAASQANTSPYSDALVAAAIQEMTVNMEEAAYRSYAVDSNSAMSGSDKYNQNIPDEDLDYRLNLRARNLEGMSMPVAQILSVAKTGTTTATVTTDRPHGLAVNDRVGIFGVRDTANFPNLTDTAVTGVVSPTQFTVVLGTASTTSSVLGGVVYLNQGGVIAPGVLNNVILSVARVNNVLQVACGAAPVGLVPGEYVHLWGLIDGASAYDGAYKVARINGATLELDAPGADFASLTTGGAIIKRTDVRVHFVRSLSHTRVPVEVVGGRGQSMDQNNGVPVIMVGTPAVAISGTPAFGTPALTTETNEAPTVLAANALFSGALRDIGTDSGRRSTRLRVMVRHLAGLTPGSLYLEQSIDNATFYETWRMPIPSDASVVAHTFEIPLHTRYYRWRFQNGATAQTAFVLQTIRVLGEGMSADDDKSLQFPLTSTALAANGVFVGPTLDLGGNHNWDEVRALAIADQAGVVAIEHSRDGATNWRIIGTQAVAAGGLGNPVDKVVLRYVRLRFTNGATAQAAFSADMALVSR